MKKANLSKGKDAKPWVYGEIYDCQAATPIDAVLDGGPCRSPFFMTPSEGEFSRVATVLIVDDSKFMREQLRAVLERGGHTICAEAAEGLQAVVRYGANMPDIVTMDIVMPGMSGVDTVKLLLGRYPQARVLMVTSVGQREILLEAIQAGAHGFVVKPFQASEVLREVQNILSLPVR